MGGKSRKSGGVSESLIRRLTNKGGGCKGNKPVERKGGFGAVSEKSGETKDKA